MVCRVVCDLRRRAEVQIPVESRRHRRIVGRHGGAHRVVHRAHVPLRARIRWRRGRRRIGGARTRNTLRPVAHRTIGPHVHFTDLAQHTRLDDLRNAVRAFHRVALIAHLRGQLRVGQGRLLQQAHLVYRIRERLLDIHVLAERHRGQGDGGMQVIGRGNQHRVDVLLLLEHLPKIRVLRGVLIRLAKLHILRRRLAGARLEPRVEGALHIREVHIAHGDDVLGEHLRHVAHAHATDANARDVELSAGGAIAGATEHGARHNHRAEGERGAVGHEVTTGVGIRHGRRWRVVREYTEIDQVVVAGIMIYPSRQLPSRRNGGAPANCTRSVRPAAHHAPAIPPTTACS